VALGGISDSGDLRVAIAELFPQRANTTLLGPAAPVGSDVAPVNDYLDLNGSTLAVSRGGDGGSVVRYSVGSDLSVGDPSVFEPATLAAGDRLGWAIDLTGGTLVAGAPGAGSQAGAAYTDLQVAATFTGSVDNSWDNGANWDTGEVPGRFDRVVVPAASTLDVTTDEAVDAIVVEVGAAVTVNNGASLTLTDQGGPTGPDTVIDGTVTILAGGTFELDTTAGMLVEGTIDNQEDGVLRFSGDARQLVEGAGVIQNAGLFDTESLVGQANYIEVNTVVTTAATSELRVCRDCPLTFGQDYIELGSVLLEPNAGISFLGAFTADPSVVVAEYDPEICVISLTVKSTSSPTVSGRYQSNRPVKRRSCGSSGRNCRRHPKPGTTAPS
jgi:hypothetical protein